MAADVAAERQAAAEREAAGEERERQMLDLAESQRRWAIAGWMVGVVAVLVAAGTLAVALHVAGSSSS